MTHRKNCKNSAGCHADRILELLVEPDAIDAGILTPLKCLPVIADKAAVFDIIRLGIHLS